MKGCLQMTQITFMAFLLASSWLPPPFPALSLALFSRICCAFCPLVIIVLKYPLGGLQVLGVKKKEGGESSGMVTVLHSPPQFAPAVSPQLAAVSPQFARSSPAILPLFVSNSLVHPSF